MQHGAAEREALLPSAGQLCGQAIEVGAEAVELDDFVHAALEAIGGQAVDAAVEGEIFFDGQIVVEAEFLRHVADALADFFGVGADVEIFDDCGAAT